MKFIFPRNFEFKQKIFGIFDYSTILINILWYCVLFFILNLIFLNLNTKIFFTISFGFPLTIFSIVGLNDNSIIYILKYLIKYLFRPKVYLFKKY